MAHTKEVAIAGTTMGLIGLDETVTWKAKHLMKTRYMKVRITAMKRPVSFTDEMDKGDFRSMKHEHHFKQIENGTLMIDVFTFETKHGVLGRLVNHFYLKKYFQQLLEQRNEAIRHYAETDKWQFMLNK